MAESLRPLVSLIIGTRNRRALLEGALESLAACRVPAGWKIELVVVDNGSTDGTSDLVRAMTPRFPFPVRCVVEPQPGLGRAHAIGLRVCRGELIVCTDDDCLVPPDWCEAIVQAFTERLELAGLFGRVLPIDDGGNSAWRVAVKTSEVPATYQFPCWPVVGFGNNMAFRRSALEAVGGFNPLFGPGGVLGSAEEVELSYRLLRSGRMLAYMPSVMLRHRARSTYESWSSTHKRDALGIGRFTGAYAIRGDLFALKLALWNWQGMITAWWQGLLRRDTARRQVGGWYAWWLPIGFAIGLWRGLWRHPAPRIMVCAPEAPPKATLAATLPISVVVCTRNRADSLRETLRSLLEGSAPATLAYEVVVVDNGSSDHTRAVVESFQQRHGSQRVVYASEPIAGLARARNAGLRVARGEIIAFTDDDCLVSSDWIPRVADGLQQDRILAGLFGRVLPMNGAVTPEVVSVKTDTAPQRFRFPCSPFIGHGNNMAFRRSALIEMGGFDIALGPGAPLGAGEELDMSYRLLRAGRALAYDPRCIVSHKPRPTAAAARATEWRNAVGIGACFGRYLVRGDGHAMKCAYWLWRDLPVLAWCDWRRGRRSAISARWRMFVGIPCGLLAGIGYVLFQRWSGDTPHGSSAGGEERAGSLPLAPSIRIE